MAQFVGLLTKQSLKVLSNNSFKQMIFSASLRQLYSPASMGIPNYLNAREHVQVQFQNIDNLFYNKMKNFVEEQDSIIFTEDLKTMLHIVEKKPESLELLYKMLKKYHLQNNIRFGSFTFGTVVLRMFYHLDEPDLAFKAFMDPELQGFFDQFMSYQLLMDLLYNHGRYDDVRAVYDVVRTKNLYGITHPRNPFILVMAACYQQNTKDSFDYASKLFQEAQVLGYMYPRRAITFLASLALKQNEPSTALEIIALARSVRYIDIRCIKLMSYIQLKRTDEIMVHLRESLRSDLHGRKQMFFTDTIEAVEKFIKDENLDETSDISRMIVEIKAHGNVQSITLHDHLSSTIDSVKSLNNLWEKKEQKTPFKENLRPNRAKDKFRDSDSRGIRDSVV